METKERTITDLLEEWAELEPKLCRHKPSAGKGFWVRLRSEGDWQEIYTHEVVQHVTLPQLQYAVQEAIEARGWWWELGYTEDGHPLRHEAFVTVVEQREVVAYRLAHSQESAAYALLDAYVQALEVAQDE